MQMEILPADKIGLTPCYCFSLNQKVGVESTSLNVACAIKRQHQRILLGQRVPNHRDISYHYFTIYSHIIPLPLLFSKNTLRM